MITRRQAIKRTALLGTAAFAAGSMIEVASAQQTTATASATAVAGPFRVPPLPYAFDALEPHIDARTMEIHHDKHHAAYVNNLNKALVDFSELGKRSIEDLVKNLDSVPEKIRIAVRNNGGGHFNHSLFWQMMKKNGGGQPKGELAKAIDQNFGSFGQFKDKFTEAATKQFGSGWAWLTLGKNKELLVEGSPNQDTPLSAGRFPLLGIDVWEHAYYLKYQNKRPDYITAFYNVIDWDFVSERYQKSRV